MQSNDMRLSFYISVAGSCQGSRLGWAGLGGCIQGQETAVSSHCVFSATDLLEHTSQVT